MPKFDRTLSLHAQSASGIAKAGEITRNIGSPLQRSEWTTTKLEALYELAYLRVFAAWETCLEAVFFRSLCGYASQVGQETLIAGAYYRSLAAAELAVLAGNDYLLWHKPAKVIKRCRAHIKSGVPGCPGRQELVIASQITRLEELAAVRHRIVHEQNDARRKFDAATLSIAGRTYPAARPGKFLRDWKMSASPQTRWLDVLLDDLVKLVGQIV